MILECPSCATRYDIPGALPPTGRKVRCAKCGHVWVALPESLLTESPPPPEPPAEEDADLVFQDYAPEPEEPVPEEEAPVMASALEEPPVEEPPVEDASMEEEPEPQAAVDPWPPEGPAAPAWEEEEQPAIPVAEWHAAEPVAAAPEESPEESQEAPEADASFEEDEVGFGEANAPLPPMPPMTGEETDAIAARTARRPSRLPASLVAGWGVLALLVLAALGGAYLFRVDVVRALPGMAKVYELAGLPVNVRNLEFEDVSYAWSVDDGRLILEVRGEVVNISDQPVHVPTVTFNLRNDQDADVYQWAADIRTEPLAARERTRFVARIPTPPKAVRSLQVRFADRS